MLYVLNRLFTARKVLNSAPYGSFRRLSDVFAAVLDVCVVLPPPPLLRRQHRSFHNNREILVYNLPSFGATNYAAPGTVSIVSEMSPAIFDTSKPRACQQVSARARPNSMIIRVKPKPCRCDNRVVLFFTSLYAYGVLTRPHGRITK